MQSFNNKLESSRLSSVHQLSPPLFFRFWGVRPSSPLFIYCHFSSGFSIHIAWCFTSGATRPRSERCPGSLSHAVANSIILQMTQAARLQPSICACPVPDGPMWLDMHFNSVSGSQSGGWSVWPVFHSRFLFCRSRLLSGHFLGSCICINKLVASVWLMNHCWLDAITDGRT